MSTSTPEGEAMVEEFRWVHGILRSELAALRELAARVLGGAEVAQVQADVEDMMVSSAVWTLRVHCLHYCRFVHGHHSFEDAAFWPRLREADPEAIGPVVDRLLAEHRSVAQRIEDVEREAAGLTDATLARSRLAAAIGALADELLAHLDYEEGAIFPTLRRMRDWRRHPAA